MGSNDDVRFYPILFTRKFKIRFQPKCIFRRGIETSVKIKPRN